MDAVAFFDAVTRPNITAAIHAQDDYKLTVNAVLSADAAYGILFEQLRDLGHPFLQKVAIKNKRWGMQDGDFKEAVASRSEAFRAIRDAAYATKHGRLGSEGRIVRSADDVASRMLVCGLFACGDSLGSSSVFITLAGKKLERAWVLLRRTELFTDDFFCELGLGSLVRPIPDYHDV